MHVAIVIPTYNENQNIGKLIEKIFVLKIPELFIIVVDDNSPDQTAAVVKEKINQGLNVLLIERPGKLGLGSAYLAGFKLALQEKADYIFEMDADFSHDPEDIPRLLEETKNADLIIGSRKIPGGKIIGWGKTRKAMSAGAMWLSRTWLDLEPKDVTAGFRCFKKAVLEKIDLDSIKSNGYAFQEELLYRTAKLGFKIKEIPVIFVDRQEGKSKLSKKDILEFFWVMLWAKFKI